MGRLENFVKRKASSLKCPVCGGSSFHESGIIAVIPNKVRPPEGIDVAYLTCKGCMFLLPFDLAAVAERW